MKDRIKILEWACYFALLFLYEFLYERFVSGGSIEFEDIPFFVGAAIGNAVIPLVISYVILLIRKRKNKTNTYHFFTRVSWITTTIILLLSIWGLCSLRHGEYGRFICFIPFVMGALYWIGKHEVAQEQEPQEFINNLSATNDNPTAISSDVIEQPIASDTNIIKEESPIVEKKRSNIAGLFVLLVFILTIITTGIRLLQFDVLSYGSTWGFAYSDMLFYAFYLLLGAYTAYSFIREKNSSIPLAIALFVWYEVEFWASFIIKLCYGILDNNWWLPMLGAISVILCIVYLLRSRILLNKFPPKERHFAKWEKIVLISMSVIISELFIIGCVQP